MDTQTKNVSKAQKIRASYTPHEEDGFDRLKKLDKKVKRPALVFGYTFGTAAALILGVGMCIALGAIGSDGLFPLGVILGALGLVMAAANVFIYKAVIKSRKKKYAAQIIELSDKLVNNG
ncbi:MAG: dihydropteridine reductase [Clostridia bacterium]|nr:dihydropteridine reductase [Clostridia bacterium]